MKDIEGKARTIVMLFLTPQNSTLMKTKTDLFTLPPKFIRNWKDLLASLQVYLIKQGNLRKEPN